MLNFIGNTAFTQIRCRSDRANETVREALARYALYVETLRVCVFDWIPACAGTTEKRPQCNHANTVGRKIFHPVFILSGEYDGCFIGQI